MATNKALIGVEVEVKLCGMGRSLLRTETKTDTKKEIESEREQPQSIRVK